MPKLSELTDYQPEPQVTQQGRLYVSPSIPTSDDGDYFTKPVAPMPELPADNVVERIIKKLAETDFSGGTDIGNKLTGSGGQERYQLWPEKIVRSALTAIPDAYSGKIPMSDVDPETGELVPSQAMIGRALDMASFAGVGGMGGTGEGGIALGAGPSLRPALKYKDRLYKGKEGQQHMDVIPPHLYPEFQDMAMKGEDISHYNFGFVNDKGHFLNREDALKYGIDSGLIDPQAGKFGALTSTLMADSSKPGTAIEAMAKTYPLAKPADRWANTLGQNDHLIQNMSPDQFLEQSRPLKIDAESRETIDALKQHMKEGKQLDPLELHANGKEDGRHRAIAAKELGIGQVPVINYRPPTQPFYSALEHNVNAISQNKMNGEAWLGTLANKPGVKPEELDWTGLRSFLEENKGKPVTKAQVEEHLASNKIELKEVTLKHKLTQKELDDEAMAAFEVPYAQLDAEQRYQIQDQNSHFSAPKYESYQLPGGENYREMLMTLPDKAKDAMLKRSDEIFNRRGKIQDRFDELYGKDGLDVIKERKQLTAEFNTLTDELQKIDLARNDKTAAYKSSHWDEPNILAHVRMNDRTIDGKKSLHLEEIQSDWHQQGRDKGYAQTQPIYWAENKTSGHVSQKFQSKDEANKYLASLPESVRSNVELKEGSKKIEGVPDAPFKKTWHELALKRMLREAAEKGYSRLSWTPGEAQAARYDLSKSVDEVRLVPKNKNTDPNFEYRIDAFKNGERVTTKPANSEKDVADIVGKEVAKKLFEENKDNKGSSLKGQQLSIGGEGMKGFYDKMLPQALEKIGKEHGVKVKQAPLKDAPKFEIKNPMLNKDGKEIVSVYKDGAFMADMEKSEAQHYIETKQKTEKVPMAHYIDIPQSLKDRAMHKGFPLFSSAYPSYSFTPVDGDPFKKDKK